MTVVVDWSGVVDPVSRVDSNGIVVTFGLVAFSLSGYMKKGPTTPTFIAFYLFRLSGEHVRIESHLVGDFFANLATGSLIVKK